MKLQGRCSKNRTNPLLVAVAVLLLVGCDAATGALLQAPSLNGPADSATGVSTTPTFSWAAVTGANRYWLMVSTSRSDLPTDPNAASCPVCVTTGLSGNTDSTSYTPPTAFPHGGTTRTLSPGTTYYWQVQGYNTGGQQGYYSTVRSFTTASTLLGAPTLTGPADGATGVSTTPTFGWNAVTGANRYWLMVSTSSADLPTDPNAVSCPVCVTVGLSGNTDQTSYTPPTAFPYGGTTRTLSPNTKYYWQVQGFNGSQQGHYSTVRSFTTSVGTPVLSVVPANPPTQPATAGSINVNVNNSGGGTMSYSARVTSGNSWLRIASGDSGGNNGTVALSYDSNPSGQRTGAFVVTANGAAGSPATVLVVQAGPGQQRLLGKKIGVDPGHGGTVLVGGSQPIGATGPTGLTEKSVNLATALALKKYLEADGATVFITRTTDIEVGFSDRAALFVNNSVDLGISVHHNGGAPSADETMTFIYCGADSATRGSLASDVVQRLAVSTGRPVSSDPAGNCVAGDPANCEACNGDAANPNWATGINGVGQANLAMVRLPEAGHIPSMLAEVSFITNPDEEQKLRNTDYLDKNGWAIYAGVADYYGLSPLPRSGPVFTGVGGSGIQPPSNGQFQFQIIAPTLQQVTVQACDDLRSWTDLSTLPMINGQCTFTDTSAGSHTQQRYYKIKP